MQQLMMDNMTPEEREAYLNSLSEEEKARSLAQMTPEQRLAYLMTLPEEVTSMKMNNHTLQFLF